MTGCDMREELAGSCAKLSKNGAVHFSGCGSQKYQKYCVISVLFPGILWA